MGSRSVITPVTDDAIDTVTTDTGPVRSFSNCHAGSSPVSTSISAHSGAPAAAFGRGHGTMFSSSSVRGKFHHITDGLVGGEQRLGERRHRVREPRVAEDDATGRVAAHEVGDGPAGPVGHVGEKARPDG